MVAGARLFERTFGWSYPLALGTGAFATVLYVFLGGFLAVSWTDTVQALLMICALLSRKPRGSNEPLDDRAESGARALGSVALSAVASVLFERYY